MNRRTSLTVTVNVVVEEDGPGFHAWCPAFKGLHVAGDTTAEAIENAKVAICAYLDSIIRHGDPLPIGPDLTIKKECTELGDIPAWMIHQITFPWPIRNMFGAS